MPIPRIYGLKMMVVQTSKDPLTSTAVRAV